MRVAILSSGYLPVLDGVTVSVRERVERLAARGHEVLLLAPDAGRGPPPVPQGVTFVPLESAAFGAVPGDMNPVPSAVGQMERALEAFRPNLIQVEEPERLARGLRRIPARAFARRRGVPLVAFFHTNFVEYWGEGGRWPKAAWAPVKAVGWRAVAALYNCFDATLVPSAESLRRLERFGLSNGVCGRFNGADTRAFSPALARSGYWGETWGLPALDGRAVMLIAGRLTPDKGWPFWREVLPALGARLKDRLGVVVAGDGDLRPQVEQMLAGLAHGHLLGGVPHRDMGPLLANSALYATLSRHENASLAVYEALASGLPVIAPRSGGIPDQVRDGLNGLLFAPGDAAGFVAAIARLADDPALAARMRGHIVAARAGLDWDRAFDAWLDAVTRIAAGAAPSGSPNALRAKEAPDHDAGALRERRDAPRAP